MMLRFVFALAALCLFASAANAACRQALALGLDVSGSVDAREYKLQLDGLAAALDDKRVRAALLTLPQAPVELLIYEWSGPKDQFLILNWTPVKTESDLDGIIDTLVTTQRRPASPGTALGSSMALGAAYLAERTQCTKRTLDISGDGKSNLGPRPQDARKSLKNAGITINGLVIGADDPSIGDLRQSAIGELASYYQAYVILGEDAFVETALGYQAYADAMARKLLREIETLTLSSLDQSLQPVNLK